MAREGLQEWTSSTGLLKQEEARKSECTTKQRDSTVSVEQRPVSTNEMLIAR